MIGCRADGLRSLRERYAVVARRACEKPISRVRKRVKFRGGSKAKPEAKKPCICMRISSRIGGLEPKQYISYSICALTYKAVLSYTWNPDIDDRRQHHGIENDCNKNWRPVTSHRPDLVLAFFGCGHRAAHVIRGITKSDDDMG